MLPFDAPADDLLGPALAGLAPGAVLNGLREQLERVAPERRRAWRGCRMIEALYHPRRYVRAAFAMLADADAPPERWWPEGDVVYLHTPPREPVSRRGERVEIGGARFEAYAFPNDRRLRGVRKFASKSTIPDCWQQWLDAQGADFRIDRSSLQRLLVRYVPEQKWIVRLRAEGRTETGADAEKRRVAVRAASPVSVERLCERHGRIASVARGTDGLFVAPRIIGADPQQGLLAAEWIRGEPLIGVLRDDAHHTTLSRVARTLTALHRAAYDGLPNLSDERVGQRIGACLDDLSVVRPDVVPRLASLGAAVRARLVRARMPQIALLHNDFHFKQFTINVRRGRFALLDFERLAAGDPLIDVANFATQLGLLANRPDVNVGADVAESWERTFLAAWRAASGRRIDFDRYAVYATLSALELARGMMRHLRPGWTALLDACLDASERALDRPRAFAEAGS